MQARLRPAAVPSARNREAGVAYPGSECRVHGGGVIIEPGDQFAGQLPSHFQIALGGLFAHEAGDLQDLAVHAGMAFDRRKHGGAHPAVFLVEMGLGMVDESVHGRDETFVVRRCKAIQPIDEFAMGIIHHGEAEFVFRLPGGE